MQGWHLEGLTNSLNSNSTNSCNDAGLATLADNLSRLTYVISQRVGGALKGLGKSRSVRRSPPFTGVGAMRRPLMFLLYPCSSFGSPRRQWITPTLMLSMSQPVAVTGLMWAHNVGSDLVSSSSKPLRGRMISALSI